MVIANEIIERTRLLMVSYSEVTKIAIFMFNNELEKPSWFENHFNEEHPNGMGKGNGRGIGRLKNN